ncbi:MAG: FKBP-type peptidyl-prolyl cis-trans isomerase [Succinivibrio sp.]|nr:FKBP-type peptidyl-prolyl cis-trans isomerase [Succinivibrio sp.]
MNKMIKHGVAVTLLALAVAGLSGCKDKKENAEVKAAPVAAEQTLTIDDKSSFEDRSAYAVGASLGTYLHNMQQVQKEFTGELKTEYIIKGFTDAISQKSQLDNKAIETTLRDLDKKVQEGMQAKMQKEAAEALEAGNKFLEENKVKEGVKVTESGLQYKVIKEGDGVSPKQGDTISVIYKGSTIDGQVFDEQKEAVDFPLQNMIPGWVEGLQLMKAGSQYEFYIPAKLAYGENGAGDVIKPNSVLIFDVTLVSVKPAETKAEAKDEAKAETKSAEAGEAKSAEQQDDKAAEPKDPAEVKLN